MVVVTGHAVLVVGFTSAQHRTPNELEIGSQDGLSKFLDDPGATI